MPRLWIELGLLQNAPVGIAVIESGSGMILDANETYCDILGRARGAVVGKTWMHFTHPDDLGRDLVYVRDARNGAAKGRVREKRYVGPNGNPVHVDVSVCPVSRDRYPLYDVPDAETPEGRGDMHISIVVNRDRENACRERLRETVSEVFRSREAFCSAIAELTQFRDRETGEHLLRTKAYVRLLLRNLPDGHVFGEHGVRLITRASTLHDIGKVGIPDSILLKRGPLSHEEYIVMQTHTTLGARAIRQMARAGGNDPALSFATQIAESHHERWDATGYPNKVGGERIPLVARVMTIADVYDALRSDRPYKERMTHAEAAGIIRAGAGTQFDPALVRVFNSLEARFSEIAATEERVLERIDEDE